MKLSVRMKTPRVREALMCTEGGNLNNRCPWGGVGFFSAFIFILLGLTWFSHKNLDFYLAWNCLKSLRWWVVGIESNFSVQLWSKLKLGLCT